MTGLGRLRPPSRKTIGPLGVLELEHGRLRVRETPSPSDDVSGMSAAIGADEGRARAANRHRHFDALAPASAQSDLRNVEPIGPWRPGRKRREL